MQLYIQSIISGILSGGVYGSVALGLSLIFGVVKIINFAHGSFLMVGMFISYWIWYFTKIDPIISSIATVPLLFVFGYYVQYYFITPLIRREKVEVVEPIGALLLTAGLSLALDNLALLFFKGDFRIAQTAYSTGTLHIGEITFSLPRLFVFGACMLMYFSLTLVLNRSMLGRAIRATAQDREAAAIQGINIFQIYSITFGLGSATLGLAGAFLMPFFYVHPSVGLAFTIKAFIIVVLGGLGSLTGALLGGIIIGLIESVGSLFFSTQTTDLLVLILFVVILIYKPSGLLGKE